MVLLAILHVIMALVSRLSGVIMLFFLLFAAACYLMGMPTDEPLLVALYAGAVFGVSVVISLINFYFLVKITKG